MPLKKNRRWIVGLDIGGTFTDVMMADTASGKTVRYKALTTPADPSIGALGALEAALREGAAAPGDVAVLLHATTLVSNALIERKGAHSALVTTRGVKDVMVIARE
jgi:N-methylhydantoinase A/oxoprolinase/acetone carboxylase beta subunit